MTTPKPHLHIMPGSGDYDTNGPVPPEVQSESIQAVAETYREAGYSVTIEATEKHVATHQEINRMAAELIGYYVQDIRNSGQMSGYADMTDAYILVCNGWHSDGAKSPSEAWGFCPDFCSPNCPHSLTAQLLAKVETAEQKFIYVTTLNSLVCNRKEVADWIHFHILTFTPKEAVIAVLQACNVWPSTWCLPEQEEPSTL